MPAFSKPLLVLAVVTGAEAFVPGAPATPSLRSSSAGTGSTVGAKAASPASTVLCAAAAGLAVAVAQRPVRAVRRAAAVDKTEEKEATEVTEGDRTAAARRQLESSVKLDLPVAVPFLGAPAYRNFIANVPGDSGFDPLGFAKDMDTFKSMQEAEIKHARLAMLAAVGWPIAELDERGFAAAWGLRDDLAKGGFAPSVLNGGLWDDAPIGLSLGIFFLIAAIIDLSKLPGTPPGFYGFDPLNLKGFTPPMAGMLPKGRQWMGEAELKNGRLAMLAITAYAFQEFVSKVPVVQETPYLF